MPPVRQLVVAGVLAVAVLVAVVGVLVARAVRPPADPLLPPPPVESSLTAAGSPTPAATVVVDVAGKVRHPGLVRLPQDSRVADAVAAAGGALPGVDLSTVNLASRVSDGQQVVVGLPGAAAAGGGGSPGPVSLSSATAEQLDALPGVGPVLAQRIVTFRAAHGPFRSVDDLSRVPGIGPSKLADLKGLVMP